MCSVGDVMKMECDDVLSAKYYKCADCNNEFKGIGKKVICPSCQSSKTSLMFPEE